MAQTLDQNGNVVVNGFSTNVSPQKAEAIPVSLITSQQQPLQIPQNYQDQTNYTSIAKSLGDLNGLNQAQQLQEEQTANEQRSLLSLQNALAGRGTDIAQTEQQAGISQKQQDVINLQNQLRSLQNEALAVPMQLQEQVRGQGVTTRGIQPLETSALRNNAIQSLTISAQLQAAQGNLALAQQQVERAVNLKYQDIENQIKIREQIYQMNKEQLERIDKKRADALNLAIKREDQALAEKKANETKIGELVMNASSQGAPSDIVARAQKAKTPMEAASILGVYSGDYLKNELLREQLKQARVKTSTISSEGRELVTQNGVQLVKVTPKEIQDLNDTQIAKNSLVSLVDNMINSIDKFGTQVLFGKEAGTRSGAKTNLLLAMKNLEKTGALDKGTIDVLSGTIPESEFFATEAAQKAALQQLRNTVVDKTDEYINSYKGTTAETDPRTKRIYEQTGFISTGNSVADDYIRKSMNAIGVVNTSMSTPNAVSAGFIDNQK